MAPPRYRTAVHVEARYRGRVRPRTLGALARRALAAEGVAPGAALSMVIAGDAALRRLNRRYRGVDAPTDVLSFALESDDGFPAAGLLGEVVISYPTAARQARAGGRPVADELGHLLVHGVLHLLGYDHASEREARAMRAREEALLGRPAH